MKPPQPPTSTYSRVQSAPGSRSPVSGDSAARHGSAAIGAARTGSGAVRRGGTASRVSQRSAQICIRRDRCRWICVADITVSLSNVLILHPDPLWHWPCRPAANLVEI